MGKYLPDFRRRFLSPSSGQFFGMCVLMEAVERLQRVCYYLPVYKGHVAEDSDPCTQNYNKLKSHVGSELLSADFMNP
jgi:hypothetical protein